MSRTAADVTPEEMEAYRATYRKRLAEREARRAAMAERAWGVAHECARILREQYGVGRVELFGSLARGRFGYRSDIDLAVWGLPEDQYLKALGDVMDAGGDVEVSLVLYERCRPSIQAAIERDGVPL